MIKGLLTSLLLFSVSTTAVTPATYNKENDTSSEDMLCLARNIYFEARNQSLVGQIAVAQVTLNRVYDSRFPNSICSVVTQARTDSQGNPIRHKCQFSWYCDGKSDKMRDIKEKNNAMEVALNVVFGVYPDLTDGATHYHTTTVAPRWRTELTKVGVIEDHVFYRWDSRKRN